MDLAEVFCFSVIVTILLPANQVEVFLTISRLEDPPMRALKRLKQGKDQSPIYIVPSFI